MDKDLILAEIEKLRLAIAEEKKQHEDNAMWYNGINHGISLAVQTISKAQEKLVSDDLNEAAQKHAKEFYPDEPSVGLFGTGDYEPYVDMSCERERAEEDFVDGAQWQKDKLIKWLTSEADYLLQEIKNGNKAYRLSEQYRAQLYKEIVNKLKD